MEDSNPAAARLAGGRMDRVDAEAGNRRGLQERCWHAATHSCRIDGMGHGPSLLSPLMEVNRSAAASGSPTRIVSEGKTSAGNIK